MLYGPFTCKPRHMYVALRELNTLCRFLSIFTRKVTFVKSCFALPHTKSQLKMAVVKGKNSVPKGERPSVRPMFYSRITKTCLYSFDPLKPHFYIVKLGFTGVYIIFINSAQKHRLWVLAMRF